MRISILIIALCVGLMAEVPNGTAVTQTVTINSAYVSETATDFLLQFKVPRTGDILANCTSATNVAMTNLNDTLRRARWVIYTEDTLYVYAHTAKSTSANTVYRLHYGLTLNEVNSSSAFTNSGYNNFWGMEETGFPIADYASNKNLTTGVFGTSVNAPFYKGVSSVASTDLHSTDNSILASLTQFTYSVIFTPSSIAADNILFAYRNGAGSSIGLQYYYNSGNNTRVFVGGSANYGNVSFTYNTATTYFITVVYDGTQSTNANRLKLYINGNAQTLTYTGTIPASIPTIADPYIGMVPVMGYVASPIGVIDNQSILSTPATAGLVSDTYKELFTSTFWTLGAPAPVSLDTITLTCTATGYDSLRWFHNGVATDSTGLTYTIYADSAWYAAKQVYYAMAYNVGGATKSGEWVFNAPANRQRKITIGPNLKIY